MRTRLLATSVLSVAALGLAACGGGGETASANDVTLVATEFAYSPSTPSATAGEVTISMDNQGEAPHNLAIEGVNGDADIVSQVEAGASDSGSVTLEAGTYTIYCSIAGHREAGMEATLTVE